MTPRDLDFDPSTSLRAQRSNPGSGAIAAEPGLLRCARNDVDGSTPESCGIIKSFLRLFLFAILIWLFVIFFPNNFASSYADESLTPREILYLKLQSFFGELRGTFRFPDEKLFQQVASGLEEYDLLSDRPVVKLPRVGNDLYLETGSTAHDYPLFSAVVITSSEKVVAAALLDSAGLAIFMRSSPENNLYIATFEKWAQVIWCSETPFMLAWDLV